MIGKFTVQPVRRNPVTGDGIFDPPRLRRRCSPRVRRGAPAFPILPVSNFSSYYSLDRQEFE